MSERRSRKEHRLANYDYSQNGAYFVTICTKNMVHYFWDYKKPTDNQKNVGGDAHIAPPDTISTTIPYELSDIGNVVLKYLIKINGVSKYVIMPNHIHIIITIDNYYESDNGAMWASPPTQSLIQRIRSFKTLVTKEIGFSPWQRNYYDRVLRNNREYLVTWQYIENNPINWLNGIEEDEFYKGEIYND